MEFTQKLSWFHDKLSFDVKDGSTYLPPVDHVKLLLSSVSTSERRLRPPPHDPSRLKTSMRNQESLAVLKVLRRRLSLKSRTGMTT